MSVSSTERSIKCRLRQRAKGEAVKQIQESIDFLQYSATLHKAGLSEAQALLLARCRLVITTFPKSYHDRLGSVLTKFEGERSPTAT